MMMDDYDKSAVAGEGYAPPSLPMQGMGDDGMGSYAGHVVPDAESDQIGLDAEGSDPQPQAPPAEPTGTFAFLSVAYYRKWFNVGTTDVVTRWRASLLCRPDFLDTIKDSPDAYGPFWNATTLIFLLSIAMNCNSWLAMDSAARVTWQYDFNKLVSSAVVIYGVTCVVPFVLWVVMKQIGVEVGLDALFCAWGYAWGPWIVGMLLCIVPSNALVWISLVAAAAISLVFKLRALLPKVLDEAQAWAPFVMAGLAGIELLLLFVLKLWYY